MNILLKRILKYIEQKFLRKTNMDDDPLCYKSLRNISDKRRTDVVSIFLNITKYNNALPLFFISNSRDNIPTLHHNKLYCCDLQKVATTATYVHITVAKSTIVNQF